MPTKPIEFNTTLGDGDWDYRLAGWRCEALLIPSARVTDIYFNGNKADTKSYSIERGIIRWTGTSKPSEIVVVVSLSQDLPGLEEEKLRLEQEKLTLEKQKARVENRWKFIAALGTIFGFLVTFLTTQFWEKPKQTTSVQPQPSMLTSMPIKIVQTQSPSPTSVFDTPKTNKSEIKGQEYLNLKEGENVSIFNDGLNFKLIKIGSKVTFEMSTPGYPNKIFIKAVGNEDAYTSTHKFAVKVIDIDVVREKSDFLITKS